MPIRPPLRLLGIALLLVLTGASPGRAQSPPEPPVITEPARNGHVVSPADVHMEAAPMRDPDGDAHDCTDWEIWTVDPARRVWRTDCITGVERQHSHLGDGVFEGSHAGRTELLYDTSYRLRVRYRDDTGLWSAHSERFFSTGSRAVLFPLELDGVAAEPAPSWTSLAGAAVELPGGADPPALRLGFASGEVLLTLRGRDDAPPEAVVADPQPAHRPLRVEVSGGAAGAALPATHLAFTDAGGTGRDVYLPPLNLAPGGSARFWVSLTGSTYHADPSDAEPDFTDLAQGAPVPWTVETPGYEVEVVASGFRLPVHIAFVPEPGPGPDAPFFYVTELYGDVKVVTRGGEVRDYATGLLNFDPTGLFPGSGEQGLSGIVVDPTTGDVLVATLYDAAPPNGPHHPKVVRLHSTDGGLTASSRETLLDMPGETQGQSHFISNLSIGPDGRLYVHMGDGFDASTALDLDSFRGKILRVALDGAAPPDNPFYDASDGVTARDYVYAYGLRNPFGGAWRAAEGALYSVENGPGSNDRLARIEAGESYGWNGSDESMTVNALFNWGTPHAPVDIAFVEPETFGGSGFPEAVQGDAFVTESGPTWASGPQTNGKRIVRFDLDATGGFVDGPVPVVAYGGSGKASASALAAGPDGLYFADLYKDQDYDGPTDRGANVLRVRFVGGADFAADVTTGDAPLTVQFTDRSTVPEPSAWSWSFGDGATSSERDPAHTYTEEGAYTVRLSVTGADGVRETLRRAFVVVGDAPLGLRATYFDRPALGGPGVTRIDPTVDFDWGAGSPLPGIPSDDFSARWTGSVRADASGDHTFITVTDDGVRLWVDDRLVIDAWVDQPPTEHRAVLELEAGRRYSLRMEYYERGGGAVARLLWTTPETSRGPIPQTSLYPTEAGVVGPPGDAAHLEPPFPNPFGEAARVRFSVPEPTHATLVLYDVLGREARRLFDGVAAPSRVHELPLDGDGLPSGVYVLHLRTGDHTVARTVVHVGR